MIPSRDHWVKVVLSGGPGPAGQGCIFEETSDAKGSSQTERGLQSVEIGAKGSITVTDRGDP